MADSPQNPPPSEDPTTPLPPAGAQPPPSPEAPAGWTAGPGAGGAPSGPGQPAYGATWSPPAAVRQPSSARRLWGEATATTGSRIALAVAAVLGVVLLLIGVGLVGSFVVHRMDRVSLARGDGAGPWGAGGGPMRGGDTPYGNNGRGNGNGNGNRDDGMPGMGPGWGEGRGQGQGQGQGRGQGQGLGGLGAGGLGGLGALLHGEFTTTVTGTPTVMVFQTGQVTAYTAGKSLTVKSSDGFQASYVLDASTTTRGAAGLASGSQVRVVAAKEGMKAVLVMSVAPAAG
jgi:hypothetical protein